MKSKTCQLIIAALMSAFVSLGFGQTAVPPEAEEIAVKLTDFVKKSGGQVSVQFEKTYQSFDGAQERWSFRVKDLKDPSYDFAFSCKAGSTWDQFLTEYYGQLEMLPQAVASFQKSFQKAFSDFEPPKPGQ